MTKAELMELVGKTVIVYLKNKETGLYGTLNYADEFSAKHDYRKPNYFYIDNTSFKVSHVRKIEELKGVELQYEVPIWINRSRTRADMSRTLS